MQRGRKHGFPSHFSPQSATITLWVTFPSACLGLFWSDSPLTVRPKPFSSLDQHQHGPRECGRTGLLYRCCLALLRCDPKYPVYCGGSTHTYKSEKQNFRWHKKDNSLVLGSVHFLQLWVTAQQLGLYGGSLGWRRSPRPGTGECVKGGMASVRVVCRKTSYSLQTASWSGWQLPWGWRWSADCIVGW